MDPNLKEESARLARCWAQHEPAWLERYLVSGVEDPRRNLQSVLSRQFILRALFGPRFHPLEQAEYRFAAVMNWLAELARTSGSADDLRVVLHTLKQGGDNAEGIEIPRSVLQTFRALPSQTGEAAVPNYIESFLSGTRWSGGKPVLCEQSLNTFQGLWRGVLQAEPARGISVLEPACGSANDYRFLDAYGIARLIQYTGVDICEANVRNARALYPNVGFRQGNVFELESAERSFQLCFVHDLFEHLSPAGLEQATAEICRVAAQGICVGFFNMDEIPDTVFEPVEEYYWNRLSMDKMRALFAAHGFRAQVLHIGTFLRQQTGSEWTHNPNAYTFMLERVAS